MSAIVQSAPLLGQPFSSKDHVARWLRNHLIWIDVSDLLSVERTLKILATVEQVQTFGMNGVHGVGVVGDKPVLGHTALMNAAHASRWQLLSGLQWDSDMGHTVFVVDQPAKGIDWHLAALGWIKSNGRFSGKTLVLNCERPEELGVTSPPLFSPQFQR